MAGTLYVVSTPIGNLEDVTLRALRILKECDLIAAEDTRVTRKLLSRYDIHTPLTSYHQHSRGEKSEHLAGRLAAGESIALVSDAGTPGVSDPGADLISMAIDRGVSVVPVPGPNAALAALVASGLSASRFAFDGFPPRGRSDRRAFFGALRAETRTVLLYESPGRIAGTIEDLYGVLGDRPVAIGRELTKAFEEIYRGTLSGAITHLALRRPRGEFTVVLGAAAHTPAPESTPMDVESALRAALSSGDTSRDAVQRVAADLQLPRRLVYRTLLRISPNR